MKISDLEGKVGFRVEHLAKVCSSKLWPNRQSYATTSLPLANIQGQRLCLWPNYFLFTLHAKLDAKIT